MGKQQQILTRQEAEELIAQARKQLKSLETDLGKLDPDVAEQLIQEFQTGSLFRQ